MTKYLVVGLAIISMMLVLFAVAGGVVQAGGVAGSGGAVPLVEDPAAQGDLEAAMLCLALVGGAAILAGGVWARMLDGLAA